MSTANVGQKLNRLERLFVDLVVGVESEHNPSGHCYTPDEARRIFRITAQKANSLWEKIAVKLGVTLSDLRAGHHA